MIRVLRTHWYIIGVLLAGFAVLAEPIDPRFPSDLDATKEAEKTPLSRWLPSRISQLKEEREQLLRQIDA